MHSTLCWHLKFNGNIIKLKKGVDYEKVGISKYIICDNDFWSFH